jgi:hypothetical protein
LRQHRNLVGMKTHDLQLSADLDAVAQELNGRHTTH